MAAKETKKEAAARAARERLTKAASRERQSTAKNLSHPVFALAAERAKDGFAASVEGHAGRVGASAQDANSEPIRFFSQEKQTLTGKRSTAKQSTSEQSTSEQSTSEQSTSEKSTSEQSTSEQSASERSASERSASEQSASEQSASERSASEQSATEQSATERSATERSATERSATERSATERSTTEQSTSEQSASERSASEQATRSVLANDPSTNEYQTTSYPLLASTRTVTSIERQGSGETQSEAATRENPKLRSTGGKTIGLVEVERISANWDRDFSKDRDFVEAYIEHIVGGGARMTGFVQFYGKLYRHAVARRDCVLHFTRGTLLEFTRVKSNDTLTEWLKRGKEMDLFDLVVLRFSKGSFAAGTYILLRFPWINKQ